MISYWGPISALRSSPGLAGVDRHAEKEMLVGFVVDKREYFGCGVRQRCTNHKNQEHISGRNETSSRSIWGGIRKAHDSDCIITTIWCDVVQQHHVEEESTQGDGFTWYSISETSLNFRNSTEQTDNCKDGQAEQRKNQTRNSVRTCAHEEN